MATPSAGSSAPALPEQPTLFGHPTSLFVLFFAEMWERFSYYGMRALLVLYMIKGFLAYGDGDAYKVYGAYTALVYMTPFIGGMLADRLLGARRAVILGGLLMAAGHLLMTIEAEAPFFVALALLIVGNGFFKPNISTIVGSMYGQNDARRDGGFTIFYMGINLGAAMAPLLCGYVGETLGWHYGFGLATVGMLVGLAVFVVPTRIAQALILGGAISTAVAMVALQDNLLLLLVNGFVALALAVAGVIALLALNKAGLPAEAGAPPDPTRLQIRLGGVVPLEWAVYLGSLVVVPVFALLVWSNRAIKIVPAEVLDSMAHGGTVMQLAGTLLGEVSTPAGLMLLLTGGVALAYIMVESFRSTLIERHRLWVVLIMMVFSALFWAFFEQAGSSVNNFTDRNIDRVFEERQLTAAEVGQVVRFRVEARTDDAALESLPVLGQEQLGYTLRGTPFTMTTLTDMRAAASEEGAPDAARVVEWPTDKSHVGMGIGGSAVPASTFQSANPIYILTFGLVFSALWGFLGKRGLEPSTPIKFALGLLQLGLGFAALWYGAQVCDARGMVGMSWLLLGYLLHTTGELCISPVGLSMVTKLSPARLVSTVMGAWFLAMAFSSYLAAIIATFTGVGHGGEGPQQLPIPLESVHVYGDIFGSIALSAVASAVILVVISPLLKRWMHEDVEGAGEQETRASA